MMSGDPKDDREAPRGGRLVVVDDHPSYADGLKSLLETLSELRVVGIATDGEVATALVDELVPDLVLLDVHMPHREGVETAKEILARRPEVKVAMLTVSEDPQDITECVRAGVCGYLSKQIDTEELITCIRTMLNGESVFGSFVMSTLLNEGEESAHLNDEDIRVLRLLAQGLDRAGIAREVALSESSLKRLLRDIERKLGVENRIQAVAVAAKKGLI